jgi:putative Holliday junction resolvase
MRIMAVDPGKKHIGVAISDPTETIATPLTVLKHISRPLDAASIANLAQQYQVGLIVMGRSLDEEGLPTPQSRLAERLAEAIQQQCDLPVTMYDESFSTQQARQARIDMGTSRRKRRGHLDDLAAAVILQSFLDMNINR